MRGRIHTIFHTHINNVPLMLQQEAAAVWPPSRVEDEGGPLQGNAVNMEGCSLCGVTGLEISSGVSSVCEPLSVS